jgi:hypothetical protein
LDANVGKEAKAKAEAEEVRIRKLEWFDSAHQQRKLKGNSFISPFGFIVSGVEQGRGKRIFALFWRFMIFYQTSTAIGLVLTSIPAIVGVFMYYTHPIRKPRSPCC